MFGLNICIGRVCWHVSEECVSNYVVESARFELIRLSQLLNVVGCSIGWSRVTSHLELIWTCGRDKVRLLVRTRDFLLHWV